MVTNSKRPNSMPPIYVHLTPSGNAANEPVGPNVSPIPAPTFDVVAMAPDMAVIESNPQAEPIKIITAIVSNHITKNVMTDDVILLSITLP